MKRYLLYACMLMALGLTMACGGDDPELKPDPETPSDPGNPDDPIDPSKPYFKADLPDSICLYPRAYSRRIYLDTNIEDLEVTSSEPWCHVSIDKFTLDIEVDTYEELAENGWYYVELPYRTCHVKVRAGTVKEKDIVLCQESHPNLVSLIPEGKLYLKPQGESKIEYMHHNMVALAATTKADWLKVEVQGELVRFTSTPKPLGVENRWAVVYFYPANRVYDSEKLYTLNVYDADPTVDTEHFGYGEGSEWE